MLNPLINMKIFFVFLTIDLENSVRSNLIDSDLQYKCMHLGLIIAESNMRRRLSRILQTWQQRRQKIDDRFYAIRDILEKNRARVWRMQTVSCRRAAIKVSWVKLEICMHEVYRTWHIRSRFQRTSPSKTSFFLWSAMIRSPRISQWLILLDAKTSSENKKERSWIKISFISLKFLTYTFFLWISILLIPNLYLLTMNEFYMNVYNTFILEYKQTNVLRDIISFKRRSHQKTKYLKNFIISRISFLLIFESEF